MKHWRTNGLWSDIKTISETQVGRQALASTGAVIAATYLGYVGPEVFGAMHDALAFYAAKYPFLNPVGMAESLWDGARYFSASAIDYAASVVENIGVDMSQTARETVTACRDFISRGTHRGLEAARVAFQDTATYAGGFASEAAATLKNAAQAGIEGIKTHWGSIIAVMAAAKEAYDYYETGESIYHRLFKRGQKEVAEAGATDAAEVNLSVNTAIAGTEALETANAQLRREAVAKKLSIDIDQVIWVSEQLHDRLEAEGSALSGLMDASPRPDRTTQSIDIDVLGATGNQQLDISPMIRIQRMDGSPLQKSPELNVDAAALGEIGLVASRKANTYRKRWAESPDSAARLKALGRQTRKTSAMEFDLSDPMAFRKGSGAANDDRYELATDLLAAANDNNFGGSDRTDGPGLM